MLTVNGPMNLFTVMPAKTGNRNTCSTPRRFVIMTRQIKAVAAKNTVVAFLLSRIMVVIASNKGKTPM
jgi:hypothetical protein